MGLIIIQKTEKGFEVEEPRGCKNGHTAGLGTFATMVEAVQFVSKSCGKLPVKWYHESDVVAVAEYGAPPPPPAGPCKCWAEKDAALKKLGFCITTACTSFAVTEKTLDLEVRRGLPLERVDLGRLRRHDPKLIEIAFCPFCGRKL